MGFRREIVKGTRLIQRNAELIPPTVLNHCKGLVVLQQVKGAFFWSGSLASGFVVKRLGKNKWSPPSSVLLASGGFGFQFGFEKIDIVLVLNDNDSVSVFEHRGQINIGMDYSISVGPVGADVKGDVRFGTGGFTGTYSYCTSKGFFAGISLDGGIIVTNIARNRGFYGGGYSPKKILNNQISLSAKAQEVVDSLSDFLNRACRGEASASARVKPVVPEDELLEMRRRNREKLVEIYQKVNPEKLAVVDKLLDKYMGREDDLFEEIRVKYGLENEDEAADAVELGIAGVPKQGQPSSKSAGQETITSSAIQEPESEAVTGAFSASNNQENDHVELHDEELQELEKIFSSVNISNQKPAQPGTTSAGNVNLSQEAATLQQELARAYAETPGTEPNFSDASLQPQIRTVSLVVPQGIQPGDQFSIRAENGQLFTVICPADARAGEKIDVNIPFTQHSSQHIALNPRPFGRENSDLILFD